MTETAKAPALDREGAIAAGGQTLLGFWLEELLMAHLPLSDDLSEEQKELWIRAARLTIEELAPEGSGIGARLQALHFVCAHGAALDYQSQALSGRLPPAARTIAQRLANQLMTITSRQLTVLTRIEAERRRAKQAAAREERAVAEQAWKKDLDRGRAMAGMMEDYLRGMEKGVAATSGRAGGPDPRESDSESNFRRKFDSESDRPEPPDAREPAAQAPPLSRQQRRALERRERKAARHLAAGAT